MLLLAIWDWWWQSLVPYMPRAITPQKSVSDKTSRPLHSYQCHKHTTPGTKPKFCSKRKDCRKGKRYQGSLWEQICWWGMKRSSLAPHDKAGQNIAGTCPSGRYSSSTRNTTAGGILSLGTKCTKQAPEKFHPKLNLWPLLILSTSEEENQAPCRSCHTSRKGGKVFSSWSLQATNKNPKGWDYYNANMVRRDRNFVPWQSIL